MIPYDDDGCPKGDPWCLSANGDRHDACMAADDPRFWCHHCRAYVDRPHRCPMVDRSVPPTVVDLQRRILRPDILADLCREHGVRYRTAVRRLQAGETLGDVLSRAGDPLWPGWITAGLLAWAAFVMWAVSRAVS